LIEALRLIDISQKELLLEYATIGSITKGVFSFEVLRNLDFKDYEFLYKECLKSIPKVNNG
jgi:hypothetical protein